MFKGDGMVILTPLKVINQNSETVQSDTETRPIKEASETKSGLETKTNLQNYDTHRWRCTFSPSAGPQHELCISRRWVTGDWGSCSVTCGRGVQQRDVMCVYHLQNGSLIHTRDLYCQGPKPPTVLGCEGRLCLSVWEASEWSKVQQPTSALMYGAKRSWRPP